MSHPLLTQMEILDVLRRLQSWCETQEATMLTEDQETLHGEAWKGEAHACGPKPRYILIQIDDGSGPPLSVDALWLARMRDAVSAADFGA